MTEYLDPLYEYEKEKEYQRSYINYMYRLYGYGMWVVIEKATGKLIGRVGIENREACDGEPELGYMIVVSYQRKGYANRPSKSSSVISRTMQRSVVTIVHGIPCLRSYARSRNVSSTSSRPSINITAACIPFSSIPTRRKCAHLYRWAHYF